MAEALRGFAGLAKQRDESVRPTQPPIEVNAAAG
jgi:hypothetical protein